MLKLRDVKMKLDALRFQPFLFFTCLKGFCIFFCWGVLGVDLKHSISTCGVLQVWAWLGLGGKGMLSSLRDAVWRLFPRRLADLKTGLVRVLYGLVVGARLCT